ncbi:MAG: septal ring lytic transglycosylase RlpA family protein [Pseudomonadota bacterium]
MTLQILPHIRSCFFALAIAIAAVGCAGGPSSKGGGGPSAGPLPHYKIGKPYKINGRWYRPEEDPDYDRTGVASWYGRGFHGKATANGEIFNMNEMTAAHTTLPLPSLVEVENLENGRRTLVRVNDRGPFAKNRIIDLSRQAARTLGFEQQGLARVRVRYVGPAPLPGGPRLAQQKTSSHLGPSPQKPLPASPTKKPPSVKTERGNTIADLITSADDAPASMPAAALSPKPAPRSEFDIRIARLINLDDLPAMRETLADHGPLRIQTVSSAQGARAYDILLGPYDTEAQAMVDLDAIQKAGYINAQIAISAHSAGNDGVGGGF